SQKDLNMRRTKIVCTIGPVSRSPEILDRMMRAGMDVARLNFSHGTQAEHAEVIQRIRAIAQKLGRPVAILQDLAGPKVRIGEIANGPVVLKSGDPYTLTARDVPGNGHEVSLVYKELPDDVCAGDTLLLADGALEMKVESVKGPDILCRVVVGGPLSSHKGINLPTSSISAPILSEKDKSDLAFGLKQGVDYVAISFVRSAKDVLAARRFMQQQGIERPLIAKIEKHEALDNIDDIIKVVDGVMVARGDLGVEIPLERVPHIQKMLIEKANRAGKPVITATQMLKSMCENPRPTRAEVNDVANAVLDGTDAVMLSEESAAGSYPVLAVETMAKIAAETDNGFPNRAWTHRFENEQDIDPQDAVAIAACELAEDIHAAVIVTCTNSGSTTRRVARCRPPQPILAPTADADTYHRLALIWGAVPLKFDAVQSDEEMILMMRKAIGATGLVKPGQTLVVTAGLPLNVPGTTNMIKVLMA
ncbi:MAG: pyruvate kinase, partial [bacterium]